MKEEEIRSWIEEAKKRDYTKEQVRTLLKKNKYAEKEIEKVISYFENYPSEKPTITTSANKPPEEKLTILEKLKIKKPNEELLKQEAARIEGLIAGKETKESDILEKYEINVDGAKVEVKIIKDNSGITYNLFIPKLDVGTS